jgi:hypothetical protein
VVGRLRRTDGRRHGCGLGRAGGGRGRRRGPGRPRRRGEALAGRIREFEGEVSLLETASPSPEWGQELVGRFNEARDAEYAEVVENVERFEDEVRRESRKGKFIFAELEDLESDWEKIGRWHERVRDRDFFGAQGASAAVAALERGRAALGTFAARVYTHEGVQPDRGDSEVSSSDPTRGQHP